MRGAPELANLESMSLPGEITEVLKRLAGGESGAFDQLLSLVYEELRTLAHRAMRPERADHTLEPTALVHEVYLKLLGQAQPEWHDRAHFFAVAARAMRHILVDYARKASSKRRREWQRESLSQIVSPTGGSSIDILALDEVLTCLGAKDARKARVVELRYFGGLSSEESAKVLGITSRTVDRDWQYAQVWLLRELTRGTSPEQEGR